MLTARSAKITWDASLSPQVTSYLISYTTTAEYTKGGRIRVYGQKSTSYTITSLEENTEYVVTVQAMINNIGSSNNPKVTILTYSDGKLFIVKSCQ